MITVPEHFWNSMLDGFAAELRTVEQVCYFDGIVAADDSWGVVTTITFPNAKLYPGRFEVPAEAMSQAGKHFRVLGMQRLTQIHTHPDKWTGHSPWDDAKAYSQRPGAISIVLPHFGRGRPTLSQCGVHLKVQGGWKQIETEQIFQHLRIIPSELDFRSIRRKENVRTVVEPPRKRPWWKIFGIR